jgi:hypothetical protein
MLGDIFELLVNYYAEWPREKDPTSHFFFFFTLVLYLFFFAHVVSSLAYPNLLGNKMLGCCCCIS